MDVIYLRNSFIRLFSVYVRMLYGSQWQECLRVFGS